MIKKQEKPSGLLENGFPVPCNVEAEQALLGCLLIRNDILFSMPQMKGDFFFEPLHGRIFDAICQAVEKGMIANPITLKPIFDADPSLVDIGGGSYLAKLVGSAIIVVNIEDYVKVIMDTAQRRRLIEQCYETISTAANMTNNLEAGDIAADLALACDHSSDQTTRYRIMTEREITERIYDRMKNRLFAEPRSTGILKLDKAMGGGLFKKKLYGLVGRKKHGKTMLAGTISNALQADGVKHIFLALEMGGEEIHQRSLASTINCYESAFRVGFKDDDGNLENLAKYTIEAKPGRIYIDAPGLKFSDLRTLIPSMIRKHKLEGFILDSWQLVKGKKDRQSEVDHLDDVAQWLAECVKKYDVWGIVTAQENQGENTRGGEGLRLACDQCYRIAKQNVGAYEAWLDMMETRYTEWSAVGTKEEPSLRLSEKFTHFEEIRYQPKSYADDQGYRQENLIPD